MPPRVAPYGTWDSPVSAGLAAAGGTRIAGVAVDGEDVYWLESRPAESGRHVLVRRQTNGAIEDVTPGAFNVRTRAHEYGGGSFAVASGAIYFCNDADQRLWRQVPGSAPAPITPAGALRYADIAIDVPRRRLVCVREDHRALRPEPENTLIAIPLAGGEIEVLAAGADFYAAPRPRPDGRQLAYVAWSHPCMPWDGSELFVAPVDETGSVGRPVRVAGGERESIVQPSWAPDGSLHYVSDRSGWWNLQRWRCGQIDALCPMEAEFGAPSWLFGLSTYGWVGPDILACAYQCDGMWHLALLETRSGAVTPIESGLTEIAFLQATPRRAVFAGASPAVAPGVYELSLHPGATPVLRLLHCPGPLLVDQAYLSRPEAVSFPTTDGAIAHGLYYPPRHPELEGLPGERPPLIVMTHGGPTGAASTALSLPLVFWTSRGFAVLDVNYRGSSGYGRDFREALAGQWGLADVDDCIAGARHLVARGLVDGERLLIRGGSAGGYTTLCALTFRRVFRTGASYYGVGDLEGLARDTHKFESRYLERLIGPYPGRRDLYRERSPLHHADRLTCPVIFFQGLEDMVVPPDQAERMVAVLRGKGVAVEYIAFPDEQHGFRRAENIARALEAELAFYRRVLGLSPPGSPAGVP